MVKQRLARFVFLRELAAPRMTLRAHLDLALGRARLRADGIAARCVHTPRNAAPLVETRCQALGAIIFRRLPARLRLGGPLQMARTGAVTCFATHADFRPAGLESDPQRDRNFCGHRLSGNPRT